MMARLTFSMDSPSKLAQLYGLSQLFMNDPNGLASIIESAARLDASEYVGFVDKLLDRLIAIIYR